jgi:hypothetical protein
MSDPFQLLSEEEKVLVEESVLLYKTNLSERVIALRERECVEDNLVLFNANIEPVEEISEILLNLNIDSENTSVGLCTEVSATSILSEGCAMCLETTFESPNFKLVANCECSVTGCFECWSRWFNVNRNETVMKCPKCRRDISAFLLEQGFSPQPRQYLCSYCRRAGHNTSTCSDRIYDEDNDRIIIL